jgi:curved DNA-binding protein CbpA
MAQKNYYQLLHVHPQATAQEIKAAYRKLAFKYHPDRNKGNTLTEAVLKDINEAYSILSNPEKRKKYNALIAVNTHQSKHKRPAPLTSQTILQNAIKLKQFVEKSNAFSINQDTVFNQVQTLLSDYHLNILSLENNPELIHQFIQQVLISLQPLHSKNIQSFFAPLQKLGAQDKAVLKEIHAFYQQKKEEAFWQRYKIVVVFIVALLLCLLMYFL